MEPLLDGYGLIEGPVWNPGQGLLFSDVLHGGVYCLPEQGGPVQTVLEHRRGIGGMALHASGELIVSGRNVSRKPMNAGEAGAGEAGRGAVLLEGSVESSSVGGIVGFNDLTTDSDGRIYVGSLGYSPVTPGAEPKPGYLHLIDLDGSSRVLASGILLSNGLAVSQDGRALYHSDSLTHQVWRYERSEDGSGNVSIGPRQPFAELPEGIPDGLALSTDGAVWVAVAHGGCVLVFEPDGTRRERIGIPRPMVSSLCFGGEGLRDLYVVTGSESAEDLHQGAVYKLRPEVAGLQVPPARV